MVPLIVQIVTTLLARAVVPWKDAARLGLAVMFAFTAASHFFGPLKHDLAAMIPPPLTGSLPLIYFTGILELAGAAGLVSSLTRRAAAWGLIALLVAMFPANVYAAVTGVTIGGSPATALWLRTPLQIFWIAVLWWSAIAATSRRGYGAAVRVTSRIDAAPDRVYGVIADYRNGHPRILPKPFRNLVVERGGVGAGTVITFEVHAFGTKRTLRAEITEPQPGRVLVESNVGEDPSVTTFTVEPAEGGQAADVTIETHFEPKPGFFSGLERAMSARFLAGLYGQELDLLAAYVTGGNEAAPRRRAPVRADVRLR